jgi:hypothetical protein
MTDEQFLEHINSIFADSEANEPDWAAEPNQDN